MNGDQLTHENGELARLVPQHLRASYEHIAIATGIALDDFQEATFV